MIDTDHPIEYRKAATLEVRHAQRTIELIAAPYDEETEVLRGDRVVTESVSREAFAGVHGDVTVNRAHDLEQPLDRLHDARDSPERERRRAKADHFAIVGPREPPHDLNRIGGRIGIVEIGIQPIQRRL